MSHILLVDDDAVTLHTLARLLRRTHTVEGADDGATVLEWLQWGRRYDLILCDVMMPAMSGALLHAHVAERYPDQARRMFFMTGGVFTPLTEAFVEENRERVISKPFDGPELDAFIEYAFDLIGADSAA